MGRRWSREKGMGKGNRGNCCYGWTRHSQTGAVAVATRGRDTAMAARSPCHPRCHQHLCATALSFMGLGHPSESPELPCGCVWGPPEGLGTVGRGPCPPLFAVFEVPQRVCRGSGVPVLPLWLCLGSHRGSVGWGGSGEGSLPSPCACPRAGHARGTEEFCKGRGWKCHFLAQCPVSLPDAGV